MQQVNISNSPTNTLGRFWKKVPMLVRSILTGFGVTSLGVGLWVFIFTYVPVPWSVVAMGAILILYWIYFSGKWFPQSTQKFRRFCIRETRLNKTVWLWGLMAAFSIVVLLHSGFTLTFRIYEFQPEIFKTAVFLNDFPAWTARPIILMASLVAGICEEIGYRGYMQAPLEREYGPIVAISITSIVFAVAHIHQAWASGILMGIFIISFMIGYLAYSTGSLLPGIIAHVSFDIINFSYWWSDVLGTFEHEPVGTTGVDHHFVITATVVLLSIGLFIFAIRKLLKLKSAGSH